MKRPDISPNFTIDDIHKIREYNYERRKNMTVQEIIADTKKGADEMTELIKKARKKKQLIAQ